MHNNMSPVTAYHRLTWCTVHTA